MRHLQYESELDFDQWGRRLLKLIWRLILLIIFVEILIYVGYELTEGVDNEATYLINYVAVPGIGSILLYSLSSCICRILLRQKRYAEQSFVVLTTAMFLAALLSWIHNDVMVIQASFCIPVILSLTYVDKKAINYATGLCIAGYILFVILIGLYGGSEARTPNVADIGATLASIYLTSWMAKMVLKHQTDLIRQISEAKQMIKLDSLTGLYNYAAFYEHLDKFIQQYQQDQTSFCLILMDIDNFKYVNDTFGHDAGDDVIQALVQAIRAFIREDEDAFRYGGEEFTILTKRCPDDCFALAQSIRARFNSLTGQFVRQEAVTVSAGICSFDSKRFNSRKDFFAAADEALYYAKRTGKDKAVFWQEGILYP